MRAAILTTNMKDALDSAFLRRIRFIVHFPFPDLAAREEIWRGIFPDQTPTQELAIGKLARLKSPVATSATSLSTQRSLLRTRTSLCQ